MPQTRSPHDARKPTDADRYIGGQVRQARRELGLTQENLASLLGLTFQQVQKYEAGRSRLSAGRLQDVALALARPIGFFFPPIPSPPVSPSLERARIRLLQQDARKLVDRLGNPEDLKAAIHLLSALDRRP